MAEDKPRHRERTWKKEQKRFVLVTCKQGTLPRGYAHRSYEGIGGTGGFIVYRAAQQSTW